MAAALAGAALGVAVAGSVVVPGTWSQVAAQGGDQIIPSVVAFPVYSQYDSANPHIYPVRPARWAEGFYYDTALKKDVQRKQVTCLAVVYAMIQHARGIEPHVINESITWVEDRGPVAIPGTSAGFVEAQAYSADVLRREFARGNPVILQTSNAVVPQHFILALGTASNGQFIAHDPAGGHRVLIDPVSGNVSVGGVVRFRATHYRLVNFAAGAAARPRPAPAPAPTPTPTPTPKPTPAPSPTSPLPPPRTDVLRVPAPPALHSPGAARQARAPVVAGRVQLSWVASAGATGYEVEARDARSGAILFGQSTTARKVSVSLPAGREVQWTARACNPNGCSGNGAPLFFSTMPAAFVPTPAPTPTPTPPPPPASRPTPAPVPSVPAMPGVVGPGSTREPGPEQPDTRVTLQWSPVSGASEYDLGLRDLATGQLLFDRRVSGTSQRITLQPGGRYRWNVAACNAAGCSRFTAPLHFTVAAGSGSGGGGGGGGGSVAAVPAVPRNLSPGRTSEPGPRLTISSTTLQWAEVPGATHYELDLRDLTARRTIAVGPLKQRFHIFTMSKGAAYRWSVKACNASGCSASSERLFFTAP